MHLVREALTVTRPRRARGRKAAKKGRLRSTSTSSSAARKVRLPSATELRTVTDAQLRELARRVDAEDHERRNRAALAEADRRAKTIVETRYIQEGIKCGTVNCKCASGELHGPYWYAIQTYGDGRRKKKYCGKTRPKGT